MEVSKEKLESKFQQRNIRDVWTGMKITGFKQKDELNTFFNRFSSEISSPSSSTAHSQTDIPPSFDPQLSCHTSNVLSSTSAIDSSAPTCLPSNKQQTIKDGDAPFASPFHVCFKRSPAQKIKLERLN
ncbi:hypothetical protein ILYODFUR_014783 [Ilyodon furcidens]|uniref:Uncharacterized protein n=1 Tax=Ilyodon furcidens TaxID=33524 RepID=A0ABV0U6T2_9TELE